MEQPPVTLSEIVATLALATDVAMGHPIEQGLGSCIVATRLGELAGLQREDLARAYFVALLRHIGCTVENDGLAALVGDEIAFSAGVDTLSGAKGSEYIAAFARFATAGKGPVERARALGRLALGLRRFGDVNQAICEVAMMLASRLGLDGGTIHAVGTVYERWDGKGMPNHLRGDAIPRPVRIAQIADLLTALHDLEHDDPIEPIRARSGSGFDPDLVAIVERHAAELLGLLDAPSRWEAVQRCQPTGGTMLRGDRLDEALRVMGDFVDVKSRYLVGHSSGVAALARAAAERLSMSPEDAGRAEHAALVHDIGRVGTSVAIWDKPGSLTASEWEAVRLHAYQTDRILARSPFLAWLASAASMHHERLDGSGYFRGVAQTEPVAKLLAAADAYHAMIEPRPHRAALSNDDAANAVRAEVRAGRLDGPSVDAVLSAAGHRVGRRGVHPAGLTDREVEVLRLLARGMPNRSIAERLVVAPKTVDNHLQSIYSKLGVSTRAAATVAAMRFGLLDPLGDHG